MSDRIFGLIVALVALAYIAGATGIETGFMMDPVGPKTFPMLIGGVAALCGLLVVLKPDDDPAWPGWRVFVALAIATGVMVLYAYALKPFGFLLPTAVTAAVLSYQIRPRWLPAVFTGIGLAVGLFAIFRYALGLGLVPFPARWLG